MIITRSATVNRSKTPNLFKIKKLNKVTVPSTPPFMFFNILVKIKKTETPETSTTKNSFHHISGFSLIIKKPASSKPPMPTTSPLLGFFLFLII